MHRHPEWNIVGALAALIALAAPSAACAGEYSLTRLGTAATTGYAINARGEVTGDWLTANDMDRAFLYNPGRGMIDLGTLGGATSIGYAINARGQVTGVSVTAKGLARAFLYTPGQGMIDLGTLGGATSTGYAIDARGQVTGESVTAGGVTHGFLYTDGKILDLNALIDRRTAAHVMLISGRGINDDGWIVARGTDSRSGEMHTYILSRPAKCIKFRPPLHRRL
jgi:probable HAF family extracellular repeat protein